MSKKFKISKLLTVLLCLSLLVSCSTSNSETGRTSEETTIESSVSTVTSDMIIFDEEDFYSDWKSESPNYIELSNTGATLKGSGAKIDGSKITITSAGVYVFNGKLDNGQIIVDVEDKGDVKLVLNGAEINCSDSGPIYVKKAEKVIVSLPEGTVNTIKDGETYTLAEDTTDEPSAAIFSKGNLIINGTGNLTVDANYKDGITSKDSLKITAGNININSKDDGLIGKDMVLVKDGTLTIEAGGDGIKATNDTDTSKGFVGIQGGTFNLKVGADGIQGETAILISDGKFLISTNGGSANAVAKVEDNPGRMGKTTTTTPRDTESESAKAIKASAQVEISGGTFNIDSCDDSLHSANSVIITGGDISISAGDDGIHADKSIEIKDGNVNITKSYEGIESANITVSGGTVNLVSSDDGFNASAGSTQSSAAGSAGQKGFNESDGSTLKLKGGYISVDAAGDGLDSNGSINMTGGTVLVSGPTNDGNGPLDYNDTFEISGGLLIAAGSSGMAQATSDTSTQNTIAMTYSSTQQAGTLVSLKDSSGNILATFVPKKQYTSVVISSPDIMKDSTYELYSGGTSTGTQLGGLYKDGTYSNGTKVVSFTISDTVTWLNASGVTTAKQGMGPGGGHGGNRKIPNGGGQPPDGHKQFSNFDGQPPAGAEEFPDGGGQRLSAT